MVMAYDGTVASASKEKLPLWAEIFLSQRQFLGLTQTEVSNLTFNGFENVVSQVTVSDVETGKVNPLTLRSERLFALLNAL
jgi:predicted transcriptional regulator